MRTRFLAALLVVALTPTSVLAQTFPMDADWVPVTRDGVLLDDVEGDRAGSRDIVGDTTTLAAAFIYRDATHLFFRLRLDDDPRTMAMTALDPFGWGVEIDVDGDLNTYEYLIIVDGIANPEVVRFEENTVQSSLGDPGDMAELDLSVYPSATHVRVVMAPAASMFAGDADWFIDFAVDIADLNTAGITDTTPLTLIFGTSNSANNLASDLAAPAGVTTLAGAASDTIICSASGCVVDPDSDGDGITDSVEAVLGLNAGDGDTDDDGVPDGAEVDFGIDSDGDGLINAADPDSDNDGILDGTELGVDMAPADTDTGAGNFVPDADPSTTTSPVSADTDGGGTDDGVEDANQNGAIDAGETDPNDPMDDGTPQVDSDGDGLSDAAEVALGLDPMDADTDDDGVADGAEQDFDADTDGDGLINALDPDSDNDGVLDGTEAGVDTPLPDTDTGAGNFVPDEDPVTTTSPVSPDTDGDGIGDGVEDANQNGALDPGELDPTDPGDGDPARDSDGDTITDVDEGPLDTDGDGLPDGLDPDSDDDGIADRVEAGDEDPTTPPVDTDGDGAIDSADLDSDGDGVADGTDICRIDSDPDQLDADGDGIGDACDSDTSDVGGVYGGGLFCALVPPGSRTATSAPVFSLFALGALLLVATRSRRRRGRRVGSC